MSTLVHCFILRKGCEIFVSCTWIGSFLVDQRLIAVLYEVLNVTHFVMSSEQVVHVDPGALFDPAQ
jgi:hypothetical protein